MEHFKATNHTRHFTNKKQIAAELGMSLKTLTRKLDKLGIFVDRGLISPRDRSKIMDALGSEPMPLRVE